MSGSLEEHDGKVNPGGRTVTNLQFADAFDALVKKGQELV